MPALYPELKVQFVVFLESSASGMYAAIPTVHNIHVCLVTKGHLCVLKTAVYPVQKIEWCVYALSITINELINKYCLIVIKLNFSKTE